MKKLNTILIIFLSIIILTTSVLGVAVNPDLDEWRYPEQNLYNTKTDTNIAEYGHFDLGIKEKAEVGAGTPRIYPIISNLDPTLETNEMSIIITDDRSLIIYDQDLNVIEEYVMPTAAQNNPIVKNYDGTSYILVTVENDMMLTFTFNQTSERLILENSSVSAEEIGTNFACIDTYSNEALNDFCIAMNVNGSKLIFFDLDDYSFWYDDTTYIKEDTTISIGQQPAIGDMDRDGNPNIFFTIKDEHNFVVYNHEIDRAMGYYYPEPYFRTGSINGTGIYDSTSFTSTSNPTYTELVSNPKLFNLDGGNLELMFAGFNPGSGSGYGHQGMYSAIVGSGGTDVLARRDLVVETSSNFPMYTDAEVCNFDSAYESMCYSSVNRGGANFAVSRGLFMCLDYNGLTDMYILDDDLGGDFVCVDLDNDGSDEVVMLGIEERDATSYGSEYFLRAYSIDEYSSTPTLLFDISLENDSTQTEIPYDTIVVNDVNQDNEVDIIISGADGTRLFKSLFSNELPEWGFNINGGIYGYYSTACLNTTNKFQVIEDQSDPLDYSYTNDGNTDIEELCLKNTNGTYSCGSAASFNPYYEIYHDTTGIFTYTFVMTDDFNQGSYNSEQTINILVIDGDEGVTCNVGGNIVVSPEEQGSTSTTATATSDNDLTKELFQGNDFVMMIAALILIVGMGLGGAKVGSATGMLFGGFMGAFIGVMLGWISAWILVMVLLIIFAIAIVMKVALGSVPNGGV